jgi:LmbE family N-acetylglucosaminyl deacetylase
MPTDRDRLASRRGRPLLVELYHALSRLTSTLTVMNTGAHPDDEQSGLLALLRYGLGMRVVIACSTRGEGGQNSLGPERDGALGAIRTRELEEAARVLDADVAWLGFGPDDPVHDFGFSKSGVDTLSRWGRDRLLERLVRAYRSERPDIVIPTFLDVPGQHGHHRAMTEVAEAAIALAADPEAYPEHFDGGLKPWRVAKYYLPAWGGGGGTYDDELPPPNATVTVTAEGPGPATGVSFAEIGQWSRLFHATQGMGQWQAEPQTSWPLHLKSEAWEPEADLRDGLPANLAAVAATVNAAAAAQLRAAQAGIDAALAAFPNCSAIISALLDAARAVKAAEAALSPSEFAASGHRLTRKRVEIDAAILIAAGVTPLAWLETPELAPGGSSLLNLHLPDGSPEVAVHPVAPDWIMMRPVSGPDGLRRFEVSVAPDAELTSLWQPGFSELGGNGVLSLRLTAEIEGQAVGMVVDLETPLSVVPAHTVTLDPEAIILALPPDGRAISVAARHDGSAAALRLTPTEEFDVSATADGFSVVAHRNLRPGHYCFRPTINGAPAYALNRVDYPHIGSIPYPRLQALDILALDLKLPAGARIGYVGGGADRVGQWLARMGCDVASLTEADFGDDLSRFTTIVVGIFAFGRRLDLAAATQRLHDWVRAGGHLVTLYHRPSDGWNADTTPPARLLIGSPSLRWRVTDPSASIEILAPDHPLLVGPNRIGPDDWAGWDKERGLYFAAEWDPAYVPLLALHDAGEAPLKGGLLSARLGDGRYTHSSLVLHHQMDRLVPGAFRLMANLVQPMR